MESPKHWNHEKSFVTNIRCPKSLGEMIQVCVTMGQTKKRPDCVWGVLIMRGSGIGRQFLLGGGGGGGGEQQWSIPVYFQLGSKKFLGGRTASLNYPPCFLRLCRMLQLKVSVDCTHTFRVRLAFFTNFIQHH